MGELFLQMESENSKAKEIVKLIEEAQHTREATPMEEAQPVEVIKPQIIKPEIVIQPKAIEQSTVDNSCQTLDLKMFDTAVSCQTTPPPTRNNNSQTAIEETKEIEVYDKDGSRNKVVVKNISNFNNVENKVSIVNINQYSKKFDA